MFSSFLAITIALGDPSESTAQANSADQAVLPVNVREHKTGSRTNLVIEGEALAPLASMAQILLPDIPSVVDLPILRRRSLHSVTARHAKSRITKASGRIAISASLQAMAAARASNSVLQSGSVAAVPAAGGVVAPVAPEGLARATRGFVRRGEGEDTVWRDDDGLFYVSARINGHMVRLIVDTGASFTVLSVEDARRVGVNTQEILYSVSADTVGGATPMARVVLANLEIGQNVAAGVPAMVSSSPLRTSLLGQNVLSRLESVTIEGDRMTLR